MGWGAAVCCIWMKERSTPATCSCSWDLLTIDASLGADAHAVQRHNSMQCMSVPVVTWLCPCLKRRGILVGAGTMGEVHRRLFLRLFFGDGGRGFG